MGTIYRVNEGNPRLHYYNNALDYYSDDQSRIILINGHITLL
jgi:hypothetical protein